MGDEINDPHSLVNLEYLTSALANLSFNRPGKRNALNIAMMSQFCELFVALKKTPPRALIVSGVGEIFCSGMDIEEAAQEEHIQPLANLIGMIFRELYAAPFVTIAAVQGAAIGGGAGVMLACDFAVAAEETKVSFPEVLRGIIPAQVSVMLRQRVSMRDMRELLLLGENVDSQRALSMGLFSSVVKGSDLMPTAITIAQKASRGAPQAIAATKALLEALEPVSLEARLALAERSYIEARYSSDAKEGLEAFLSHRAPSWQ